MILTGRQKDPSGNLLYTKNFQLLPISNLKADLASDIYSPRTFLKEVQTNATLFQLAHVFLNYYSIAHSHQYPNRYGIKCLFIFDISYIWAQVSCS